MEIQTDLFGEAPTVTRPRHHRARKEKVDWRKEIEPSQPQLGLICEGFETLFEWFEDEVEKMRVGLLITSIRDVCDNRVAEVNREEVWDWINSNEIHAFAFRVCLASYDPRIEPDEMRERISWLSRKMLEGDIEGKVIELELNGIL